jgi:hypothetical protein
MLRAATELSLEPKISRSRISSFVKIDTSTGTVVGCKTLKM